MSSTEVRKYVDRSSESSGCCCGGGSEAGLVYGIVVGVGSWSVGGVKGIMTSLHSYSVLGRVIVEFLTKSFN